MWEIYTLYMIDEKYKKAVRYYSGTNGYKLRKTGIVYMYEKGYDNFVVTTEAPEECVDLKGYEVV
ncbi:hypothetical protein [Mammaliicoccus sp. P-M59]|uniref:hypothetical protein n=1 Tax=Mammaliicoccus sp. P-M59 TaxID=2898718 RepID=UPI001EFAAFEB|nr:hypothetical protein [Mammaliicoccus sp. P-M59]